MASDDDSLSNLTILTLDQQVLNDRCCIDSIKSFSCCCAGALGEGGQGAIKNGLEYFLRIHNGRGRVGIGSVVQVEGRAVGVSANGQIRANVVHHNLKNQWRQFGLDERKLFRGVIRGRNSVWVESWADLVQDVRNDHVEVEEDLLHGGRKNLENGRGRTRSWAFVVTVWHAGHDRAAAVIRADLGQVHCILEVRSSLSHSDTGAQGE